MLHMDLLEMPDTITCVSSRHEKHTNKPTAGENTATTPCHCSDNCIWSQVTSCLHPALVVDLMTWKSLPPQTYVL